MLEGRKKYFKVKRVRQKNTKKKVTRPIYICFCCNINFHSQKRFSKKNEKYRNYCKDCRKICFICLCRHGRQGKTCSSYCTNKYKSLKLCWEKLNPTKSVKTLENILSKFQLEKLDKDCLRKVYSDSKIANLQQKSSQIRAAMLRLQDIYKLESESHKLSFQENGFIHKLTFEVHINSKNYKPIEKIESWSRIIK